MRSLALMFLAIASMAAVPAAAQDLPGRVGRVAHIEGEAALYQDPQEGWEKAYVNSPVTGENSVWTEADSRAELRISGMALRLDELTQLDVVSLDEALDAYLAQGTLAVRLRHYAVNERVVFTTPNARIELRANGRYRIDVDPERDESSLTVFTGSARVGSEGRYVGVGAGRTLVLYGSPAQYYEIQARTDGFDRWARARDDRWVERDAPRYVSPYMTGYEELDAYGRWHREPDYGVLWYPTNVAADWAPYRYGRWDYVRPWGWTWVDDAPWGYAPFHYGRWVYVRDRWAWHPGERVARPTWAPALVAWIGGANFSVGVSSGGPSVGWYPLSPWDRYDPWFQASPTYVQNVNIVVRSGAPRDDRRRQWREWTRERGATVVRREAFVERRAVHQSRVDVSRDMIREARVLERPAAALPQRNEVRRRTEDRPRFQRQPQPATATAADRQPQAQATVSPIQRPTFQRPAAAAAAPKPATADARTQREAQQAERRATREARQQAREQQRPQGQPPAANAQERRREAQQEQQREAQRQATEQKVEARERAVREAQQKQEAQKQGAQQQREAQQAQERDARKQAAEQKVEARERAVREAQQQREAQKQEAQKQGAQQQREAQQAQERAQREAQKQAAEQQRAQREAQQKQAAEQQKQAAEQQRQAAEQQRAAAAEKQRAQREAQQKQAAEQREALQKQASERAQQQKAAQAARAQQAQPAQQPQAAQERAEQAKQQAAQQRAAAQERARAARAKGEDKDEKKEEEEKGKGRNR